MKRRYHIDISQLFFISGGRMKNLKSTLRLNGGFSLVSALVMLLLSNPLAQLFSLASNSAFLVVGVGLLIFGGFVVYVSLYQLENKRLIQLISLLDAGWVFGSLLIVVFQLFNLSATGYGLITGVMVIIAFFAVDQFRQYKDL